MRAWLVPLLVALPAIVACGPSDGAMPSTSDAPVPQAPVSSADEWDASVRPRADAARPVVISVSERRATESLLLRIETMPKGPPKVGEDGELITSALVVVDGPSALEALVVQPVPEMADRSEMLELNFIDGFVEIEAPDGRYVRLFPSRVVLDDWLIFEDGVAVGRGQSVAWLAKSADGRAAHVGFSRWDGVPWKVSAISVTVGDDDVAGFWSDDDAALVLYQVGRPPGGTDDGSRSTLPRSL